ncbi:hypothetical protein SASPL_143212 [Salvia splendens]|uniref:Uncharacterized protein n=1 Tax=Salvia splendens TaxID=180675 RepID=A0A8X8WND7_SALSN|nr:hypothetical protein SASPL_143212 [Salvia splendens]
MLAEHSPFLYPRTRSQNNTIWLPNSSGSVANGEICYETSTRLDQKRPHQWFMDSFEQELSARKKQTVEPFKGTSGPVSMESSLWHDGSHFQKSNPEPVQPQGPCGVLMTNNNMFTGPTYNTAAGTISVDPAYSPNKGDTHITFEGQQDAAVYSLGALYHNENSSILSMSEHSRKGDETTILYGGFQNIVEEMERSGRLITSYGGLLNQSSAHSSEGLGQKDTTDQLSENDISPSSPRPDDAAKNKKNLRGVVKGTGYMCSCKDCKLSRVSVFYAFIDTLLLLSIMLVAKPNTPNNHIYFENGKTIYAAVQELKSTPQEMLFDVMLNITGSAVNQKNFDIWKASYQAATKELNRNYGKDDLAAPS